MPTREAPYAQHHATGITSTPRIALVERADVQSSTSFFHQRYRQTGDLAATQRQRQQDGVMNGAGTAPVPQDLAFAAGVATLVAVIGSIPAIRRCWFDGCGGGFSSRHEGPLRAESS